MRGIFLKKEEKTDTFDNREEEDPDEYPFPLTLRQKRATGPTSPAGEGGVSSVLSNGS